MANTFGSAMRWMLRRARGREAERGAVVALVAIMLGTGVLVGLGAIVVDAGQFYAVRAEMQNGADAAAFKIAQACATVPVGAACSTDPNDPTSAAYAIANGYATRNANNGQSHVTTVCGAGAATLATSCPGGKTARYCPNSPTGNFVEVHTQTGVDASHNLLPPSFGRAVLGTTYGGKAVGACAQVTWGAVGSATGLAVTFSKCAWNIATNSGTKFAPGPPYGPGPPLNIWPPGPAYPKSSFDPATPGLPGGEQVLALHGSGNDCAGNLGSGWNYPGGFGWLQDDANNCSTYVDVNNTYGGSTGNAANEECEPLFDASRTNHSVVYLPIFDGVNGNGANGTYHLAGFAAFIITGGLVKGHGPPWNQPSIVSGNAYCSGSYRCLYGYFTAALIPANAVPGGTDFGAHVISLSG